MEGRGGFFFGKRTKVEQRHLVASPEQWGAEMVLTRSVSFLYPLSRCAALISMLSPTYSSSSVVPSFSVA